MNINTPISKDAKIVIIGAGAAGLASALSLHQKGFNNVKILDRASSAEKIAIPAPINLGANVSRVYDQLGLLEPLMKAGEKWKSATIRTASGTTLAYMDCEKIYNTCGYWPTTTTRTQMLNILHKSIPQDWFNYGVKVNKLIDQGERVQICRDDGTDEYAELIIVANGFYSKFRAQVMGETQVRRDGKTSIQALIPANKVSIENRQLLKGAFIEIVCKEGSIGYGMNSKDSLNMFFNISLSDISQDSSGEEMLDIMKSKFSHLGSPVREIINAISSDDLITLEPKDRKISRGWSKGRMVLVGDAAHPAFQYTGQGAAMGMESALVLATMLDTDKPLSQALNDYESHRVQRIKVVHGESYKGKVVFGLSNSALCMIRNFAMSILPKSLMSKPIQKIHTDCFLP